MRVTIVRRTIHVSRRIVLPGFEGLSLWEVIFFFAWSLRKGLITQRAASLSFNFFLAMIPFGLLLVILSAYLPFYDIEQDIVPILASFIPGQLVSNFLESMHEFENSSVSSLISFGFLLSLYFASNGFAVMINTFNTTRQKLKKRSWWSVRLVSVVFVVVFLVGLLISFFILLTEKRMLNSLADRSSFIDSHYYTFFILLNSLFFAVVLYFAIALIYYYGPVRKGSFRFFSAGATLATLMIILISVTYVYYVNEFAKYNELYGSIGTIMILLLWIYFVSIALLVGFELNASIHGALLKKHLNQLGDIEKRQEKNY
ncbi:MAG: YihY/virulence factor BrkB family protein [Bacteroidetes bacterium]|nr:YihY/virulence factor BrkB family protein [Bacteroidota bacterium]